MKKNCKFFEYFIYKLFKKLQLDSIARYDFILEL